MIEYTYYAANYVHFGLARAIIVPEWENEWAKYMQSHWPVAEISPIFT